MSYDFTIRPQSVDWFTNTKQAHDLILAQAHVTALSARFLEFSVPNKDIHAEIYLEFMDEYGDTLEWSETDRSNSDINRIRICIPFANMDDNDRLNIYQTFIRTIADDLGWVAFDDQKGRIV
jgi:hypothetical protein